MWQQWQHKVVGIVLPLLFVLASCVTAPSGRTQLILISPEQESQLGVDAFQQVLSKEEITHDPELQGVVDRIGWRIARAANLTDAEWEFVVIDDPETVNAFALPGGKVGVYIG
ncbi:MAG: M48 family metalloprotease, partial [candidate division NC10 bacterium]